MSRLVFPASFLFALAILSQPILLAQDTPDAEVEAAAPGASAANTDESVKIEAAAAVNQPLPYKAIRRLISAKKLEEAVEALEQAIAADLSDDRLHNLRENIATAYLSARKYDESLTQMKALFDYRIENIGKPVSQVRLPGTVILMRMASSRTGKSDVGDKALDRAIDAISENDLGVVSIQATASLVPLKAIQLATRNDLDGANELLLERIAHIDSLDASGRMKEALVSAKAKLLYSAASLPNASDDAMTELEEFIDSAAKQYPQSTLVLMEYGRVQLMVIAQTYRSEPKAAQERLAKTLAIFEPAAKNDRNLGMYLSRLKSYQSRIESALRLTEMVGKPAPEFQVAAWVNHGEVTPESLEGKVILLDFWSVWCGPCIATFPHLRDWYDEFQDQGLEIVGVTRYYNYRWDEETNRAKRSKDSVEADDEHEMLTKFMAHHELRHPTIVTPQDSTMQREFGVTGIPHAVLIDRKGNVQMVKVGSGESNAKALHQKIQELLAQ